jgi:hypothetical protein
VDFVDSLLDDTRFENCDLSKGEWRETSFHRCTFIKCTFDHTTVTLCTFVECEFDTDTFTTAEHRAFYFNVLSRCKIGRAISDPHFASRNFGVPATGDFKSILPAHRMVSIEQLCLLNNVGQYRVVDVVEAAESICIALKNGVQRRTSSLIFFSRIIRALTNEKRISPTSLVFLERLLSRFAGPLDDPDLFTAAMAAIIEIRSALFDLISDSDDYSSIYQSERVRRIDLHFGETYRRDAINSLRKTLSRVMNINAGELRLVSLRSGSTIVELVTADVVAVGTLLVALNFVLRQAKVAVKTVLDVERTFRRKQKNKRKATKSRAINRRRTGKVPAVLEDQPLAPELMAIRKAVETYGRVLVELDEKVDVTIIVASSRQKQLEAR